jgi:alpha-tubulin suppressor-like RCC1 family protein
MGNNLAAAIAGNAGRLAVGFRHNCVLLTNGELKCWGSNEEAELGLEDITGNKAIIGDQANEMGAALATTAMKALEIEELTAGAFHTCALSTTGMINCWGDNVDGEVGHNRSAVGGSGDMFYGDEPNEMGPNMIDTDLGT